jgi:hypothetical protein
MGFNGYQWAYRRNIGTHRAYAARHGYDYQCVAWPAFTRLLMECAWLKIPLLWGALRAGRPWVLYLDCDIEVKPGTPAVETLFEPGKTLYMVNGFSGRLNSGVMLARQDPALEELLRTILSNAQNPVPPEDDVGWGENGHVIHYAKNFPGLKILATAWNNNQDPALADHLRHYSAGPMRRHYRFTPLEKTMSRLGRLYLKLAAASGEPAGDDFFRQLRRLLGTVHRRYPGFAPVDMPAGEAA